MHFVKIGRDMEFRDTFIFKFCKKHSNLLPKKLAHTIRYRNCHKKWMDWNNPKTLDEKLHWSMVYNIGKNEALYADKLKVRDYIKACGYPCVLG